MPRRKLHIYGVGAMHFVDFDWLVVSGLDFAAGKFEIQGNIRVAIVVKTKWIFWVNSTYKLLFAFVPNRSNDVTCLISLVFNISWIVVRLSFL